MSTTTIPRSPPSDDRVPKLVRENQALKEEIERLRKEVQRLTNRVRALGG